MTFRTGLLAIVPLALGACDLQMTETVAVPARSGPATAERACISAVNANMTRGTSTVVGSEVSGAGSLVTVRSNDGTNWRCTVTGNGVVESLSVI